MFITEEKNRFPRSSVIEKKSEFSKIRETP